MMGFTTNEWRGLVASLPSRLTAVDRTPPDAGLREAIVETWRTISSAPSGILQHYERTSEAMLLKATAAIDVDVTDPVFGQPDLTTLDDTALVAALGSFLRALEAEYYDFDLGDAPVDPQMDWRLEIAGEAFLLIPLAKRAWREAKKPEVDFRPFAQRGLLRSRIVPVEIGAASVTLTWLEYFPRPSGKLTFGAVLFDKITFTEDRDDRSFLVTAVAGPDMVKLATEAIRKSHQRECLAVVFPELTVDDSLLHTISSELAFKYWELDEKWVASHAPSFVVAGSWHRPVDNGYANTAIVLDGYGNIVLKHRKRFVFSDTEGLAERIVPGNVLDLLVTEDGIFTFGICLDFCHMGYDTSYGYLNVDFVLVPSCGNAPTMRGHVARAYELMVERKTRSFVVQQAYPNISEGKGFVLNPLPSADQPTVESLISTENYSFFDAEMFV